MTKRKVFFAFSGLFPLLFLLGSPPDTTLLIYSLFVLAYFLRDPIVNFVRCISIPALVKFILLVLTAGLITEFFAWLGEYLARSPEPVLLHPQLIPDLILGFAFYLAVAIAWSLVLRFYRFSLFQIFVT